MSLQIGKTYQSGHETEYKIIPREQWDPHHAREERTEYGELFIGIGVKNGGGWMPYDKNGRVYDHRGKVDPYWDLVVPKGRILNA